MKKKVIFMTLFIIGIPLIIWGGISVFNRVSASETDSSFSEFIKENKIDLISYEKLDGKLIVNLQSEGNGRGTAKDARSKSAIMEFLQYSDLFQELKGFEMNLYDIHDKLIYNIGLTDVHSTEAAPYKKNELSRSELEQKTRMILEEYHLIPEDLTIKEILSSGKSKLSIKGVTAYDDAVSLMAVFQNFRNQIGYMLTNTEDVYVFEMTLYVDGEEQLFMHDDYLYTIQQSWMSVEMQKEYAKHYAP